MVDVNGAYSQDRYFVDSLPVMSNVENYATQESRPADMTNRTHYIGPYDTHMDQKDERITEIF